MPNITKIIATLGVVAGLGVAAMPLASVNAALTTEQTDTIEVTIPSNCELSYGATPHTDGDGAWDSNTLSATRENGSVTTGLGSTDFTVTCNDGEGSQVTLSAGSLSSGGDTISFSSDTPNTTTSSWGVNDGTSWVADGDNVWSSEDSVSGSTFSVTYGIGLSAEQPAGTYSGSATYTLTHPYVPPAPEGSFDAAFADAKATKDKTTGLYKLQDMTSTICSAVTTATTAGEEEATELVDIRDGKTYGISKLKDGKCWMTENLALGGNDAIALTSNDTNITSQDGFTLPASGSWTSSAQDSYTEPYINAAYKDTVIAASGHSPSGKVGVYYNYCAASGGTYCYESGSGTGNATQDICPKGWRLPTGGNSGEYQALYSAYGSSSANFQAALSTPLAGFFATGEVSGHNMRNFIWTSTRASGENMSRIGTYPNATFPVSDEKRYLGFNLRCVAQ